MAKLLSTLTNLLCATGTFTTIATLAVLLTTVNVCEASSNTVSITHRSYTNNHNDDNNVEVIKSGTCLCVLLLFLYCLFCGLWMKGCNGRHVYGGGGAMQAGSAISTSSLI